MAYWHNPVKQSWYFLPLIISSIYKIFENPSLCKLIWHKTAVENLAILFSQKRNFYRFLKIPPIRIKTGLGHLSSFQISSLRKGFTLESNPELPQFPGFTNPLVCQIQFAVTLHSIAISVHFATLPYPTQYYTMWPRTVSIPMTFSMFLQSLVQKFWRGRAKMEQDSITALTLLSSMELATPQTGFLDSAQQVHSFWNDSFIEHEKVHMALKYSSHILQWHERKVQTFAFITE